jgi:putative flippase GtrA
MGLKNYLILKIKMTEDALPDSSQSTAVLHGELFRFLIVGTSAAAAHFTAVLLMVQLYEIKPLVANVLAFAVAFQVSYFGHRSWTFAHTNTRHSQSLPRFMMVALLSFVSNESMYYLLLHYTPLPYWFSLGIVLVLVAIMTFVLSKLWAFSHAR